MDVTLIFLPLIPASHRAGLCDLGAATLPTDAQSQISTTTVNQDNFSRQKSYFMYENLKQPKGLHQN
jgi:hypothetical protein